MASNLNRHFKVIVVLVISLITPQPSILAWQELLSSKNLPWIIAGSAAATCIIVKIAQRIGQNKPLSYENFIKECRCLYKQVDHSTQRLYNAYRQEAQMSDWQIKEIILNNNHAPHPFVMHYNSLCKVSWQLKQNLHKINDQIAAINSRTRQLSTGTRMDYLFYFEEKFLQLAIRGKLLQENILKTLSLVSILKKRIKLFKEYNDDYQNWTQQEEWKREKMIGLL